LYLFDVGSIYLAVLILISEKPLKSQNPSSWIFYKTWVNPQKTKPDV